VITYDETVKATSDRLGADAGVTNAITAWTQRWAAMRGFRGLRPTAKSAIAVPVGRAGRMMEYMVTTPGLDTDWLRMELLAEGASPDDDWVTLPLAEAQSAEPPPGFAAARDEIEWFMRFAPDQDPDQNPDLPPDGAGSDPGGYTFAVNGLPSGMVKATCVSAENGETAGEASLLVVGRIGVVDTVEVAERHRRRGLASRLMLSLHTVAREQKAREMFLMATAAGRGLYTSLGWQPVCRVITLRLTETQT
jgi:GNAT superfamily N-acetyltransferase